MSSDRRCCNRLINRKEKKKLLRQKNDLHSIKLQPEDAPDEQWNAFSADVVNANSVEVVYIEKTSEILSFSNALHK